MRKHLCTAARAVGAAISPAPLTPQEQAHRTHQCKLMANERARRSDQAMPHPEVEHE